MTLSKINLHGYQKRHARVSLHKTQSLFEVFLKSPMGKIIGTIFLIDRKVSWVLWHLHCGALSDLLAIHNEALQWPRENMQWAELIPAVVYGEWRWATEWSPHIFWLAQTFYPDMPLSQFSRDRECKDLFFFIRLKRSKGFLFVSGLRDLILVA